MGERNMVSPGWLYLCATPIGNLEDITLRVLHTLEQVDFIACEDTRHTLKLLNHYEIKKSLLSCHEHNERASAEKIIARLQAGESAAMVSDAGMPGVSDPGAVLVQLCIEHGVPFTVLPGACAALTALVLSGMDNTAFVFEGFLPREGRARREAMEHLLAQTRTSIFYESPQRLNRTLAALANADGERGIAVLRELTKIHESVFRGTVAQAAAYFEANPPKGEFVLVLQGAPQRPPLSELDALPVEEALKILLDRGIEKKEAIKHLARARKVKKDDIYKIALELTES